MKKRIIFFILLCISGVHLFAQSKCSCEALIDYSFTGKVSVWDKPYGEIIGSTANDSTNEDYLIMTIWDVVKDYYKVTLHSAISGDSIRGWIRKKEYIGTYARNYNSPLKLYASAGKDAGVAYVINEMAPVFYTVVDCEGNWVKVLLEFEGRKYTGWIEKDMQCANPYTTCN